MRLVPDNTKIAFMKMRYGTFLLSTILMLGAVFLFFVNGLNFGIDFKGGTLVEIRTEQVPDLSQMRNDLNTLGYGTISIQEFGEPNDLLIRVPAQEGGEEIQQKLIEDVKTTIGEDVDYRRVEFVGPQVGEELIQAGLLAVLLSMGGILLYIWIRFEWQFGVAAIIALMHDAIATVGLFSLTQMEFSLSTVAAVLMIAGYSINDTVVNFDRVRENLRRYKKMSLPELFDMSINQMLARSLLTSGTTLIALIALYIFGGEVIRDFIYALIWGIVIGTYSSIFLAVPLLLYMDINSKNKRADAPEDKAEVVA
ncbi:MAG: protein translocase subunit SecF [Rickettsiales bacterium]|nr:protein translocase subunit SecF [Rickettsiales bacterium]